MKQNIFSPLRVRCLLLLFVLCLAVPALAHRVVVFAYVSGNEIFTEVSLGNNQPAVHSPVIVTHGSKGEELLEGQTDEQGRFVFPRPELQPGDSLHITAYIGQGHQGSWTLSSEDLGVASSPVSVPKTQELPPATDSISRLLTPEEQQYFSDLVTEAVAREVAPLKRMLAQELTHEPTLQDIIGGIGWLVGIGGLLFALKKKHRD